MYYTVPNDYFKTHKYVTIHIDLNAEMIRKFNKWYNNGMIKENTDSTSNYNEEEI